MSQSDNLVGLSFASLKGVVGPNMIMRYLMTIFTGILVHSMHASAQEISEARFQAKKLLERVAGVKVAGDHPLLDRMEPLISQLKWQEAAAVATEHPDFLNTTIKQMGLKMSTVEEAITVPMNDLTAYLMGVVRDDVDARELLTGNYTYIGDYRKVPASFGRFRADPLSHMVESNDHFLDLGDLRLDIGSLLTRIEGQMVRQNSTSSIVFNPDPAGVLTSRSFISAHTIAGTNRRPVEFTFRQFMCTPIEEWADTTASDARIGRDIDRYPGGDHTMFQVSCKGCHTGMDGFRGAFAKWDFGGGVILNRDVQRRSDGSPEVGVVGKMNQNGNTFTSGYVTTDNSFVNNARGPANEARFGWRGEATSGFGVKGFGKMVAESSRFSECMVKRTFEAVCRKEISIDEKTAFIKDHAKKFEEAGYNLKKLAQWVAVTQECVL